MSASLTEPSLPEAMEALHSPEDGEAKAQAAAPGSQPAPARKREGPAKVELRARLRSVGLWSSSYASYDEWLEAGAPDELVVDGRVAPRPPAALLHPRLRRRTSTLTRAAVTAIEAAIARLETPASLADMRFVLVSSFGEIETTVALLGQLAAPTGPVSPTKFHNSVHNTATGYLSIASGNSGEATALAGGPHNLEIGLLETLAGFTEDGGEAMLIFAEEQLPAPFTRADADPTFAVALHLSSVGEAASASGAELGGDLGLELRLANDADARPASVVAPGVDGVGLPTMVAPLTALLRSVAGFTGGRSSPLALVPGSDPAVASTWTLTLERR